MDLMVEQERYPRFRHHAEKASVIVRDPDQEAEDTPADEGWFDLKRDALDARAAATVKKGPIVKGVPKP